MNEVLTRAEIHERFPSEWILIADPELDYQLEVVRGRVVCHSKDRDEVYRRAVELRLPDCALEFTGSIPEGTAVIL